MTGVTVPIVPGDPQEPPTVPPQPQYAPPPPALSPPPQPQIIIRERSGATNTLSTIILIVLGTCCGFPIVSWLVFLLVGMVAQVLGI